MSSLSAQVADWLKRLPSPSSLKGLPKGAELERAVENPLFRSVQREYVSWTKLLAEYGHRHYFHHPFGRLDISLL
jgi:hypothetical protein